MTITEGGWPSLEIPMSPNNDGLQSVKSPKVTPFGQTNRDTKMFSTLKTFLTKSVESKLSNSPRSPSNRRKSLFESSDDHLVALVTDEEKEKYVSHVNEAKKSVTYPHNPCLFTPAIKIYNHNI